MTKGGRRSPKRPNTSGQVRSPNQQFAGNCLLIFCIALATTLIAWVLDHPGPILWCIRWGSLLLVLLAIGLMRASRNRTVDVPGDPRGRLRKRDSTIVVAEPHPTADGQLEDASRLSEPSPPSVPPKPRGFVGWIKLGVPVLGFAVMSVVAVVVMIPMGIRAIVSQTVVSNYKGSPLRLTGASAVLRG